MCWCHRPSGLCPFQVNIQYDVFGHLQQQSFTFKCVNLIFFFLQNISHCLIVLSMGLCDILHPLPSLVSFPLSFTNTVKIIPPLKLWSSRDQESRCWSDGMSSLSHIGDSLKPLCAPACHPACRSPMPGHLAAQCFTTSPLLTPAENKSLVLEKSKNP